MTTARHLLLVCFLFLLAGCGGPLLPFQKDQPASTSDGSLVKPPWEAYIQAGPNADKDIDLETLDGPTAVSPPQIPAPAQAVAEPAPEAAPQPEPSKKPADAARKDAVAIRFVAVPPVKGADARGSAELTEAMRQVLKEAGWPVLPKAREDALTIQGLVTVVPPAGGNQTVRLAWDVLTPQGKKLGDVKQQNQMPEGSLDQGWGENARFAAEGAAEGIFKLIQQVR